MSDTFNQNPDTAQLMEKILYEVKRVVVGQDRFLERVMVAILAQGHLLVEGVPGLAKTLTVKTLANTITGDFKRIQFTPDLVPADLVGTRIYNQKTGENWMRLKLPRSVVASVFTVMVFARPGTPSTSRWPCASSATITRSRNWSCPTTTRFTS